MRTVRVCGRQCVFVNQLSSVVSLCVIILNFYHQVACSVMCNILRLSVSTTRKFLIEINKVVLYDCVSKIEEKWDQLKFENDFNQTSLSTLSVKVHTLQLLIITFSRRSGNCWKRKKIWKQRFVVECQWCYRKAFVFFMEISKKNWVVLSSLWCLSVKVLKTSSKVCL